MAYNITALKNIDFNKLANLPIGTFVFATSDTTKNSVKKREVFPADTWLDVNDGLSYPKDDWPELAAAKPDWVKGEKIVLPDYAGRFLRAANAEHGVDTAEGFAMKNVTGEIKVGAKVEGGSGVLYAKGINTNAGLVTVDTQADGIALDLSRVLPTADEIRPNTFNLHLFVYASSVRAKTEALKLLEVVYPVGSIFTTTIDAQNPDSGADGVSYGKNPSDLLGFGEWRMLTEAAGKSFVMVDRDDPDFQYTKKTGGNKLITLAEKNLPPHDHTIQNYEYQYPAIERGSPMSGKDVENLITSSSKTGKTGAGDPFNAMNPYFTVIYWVRTK